MLKNNVYHGFLQLLNENGGIILIVELVAAKAAHTMHQAFMELYLKNKEANKLTCNFIAFDFLSKITQNMTRPIRVRPFEY